MMIRLLLLVSLTEALISPSFRRITPSDLNSFHTALGMSIDFYRVPEVDMDAKEELEMLLDQRDLLEEEIQDLAEYIDDIEMGQGLPSTYIDDVERRRGPVLLSERQGRIHNNWRYDDNGLRYPYYGNSWQTDASSRYRRTGPGGLYNGMRTFNIISGRGLASGFVAAGVRDELSFRRSWSDRVNSITIDGDAWLFVYDNGSWVASDGISDGIYDVLHSGRTTQPLPIYASMGADGQYYIEYENGEYEFVGPPEMMRELETNHRRVTSVAFGETPDTVFVVYNDGTWRWTGQIPIELDETLKLRGSISDVEKVSLGPTGEWALWTRDGQITWGGVDPDCLEQLEAISGVITDIQFGGFGSFFIRYNDF